MFSIFNKREAGERGQSRDSGRVANPADAAKKASSSKDLAFHLDIPIDDAMRAIDSRLSSFSRMEVGQAAKERGWATLQRELQRHPVRPASPVLGKDAGAKGAARVGSLQPQPVPAGHPRGWRIAISSAGVMAVVVAALLGAYAAGLLGGSGVGPSVADTTTVSVATVGPTTVTTAPVTTSSKTGGSTVTPNTSATAPTTGTGSTTASSEKTPGTQPTTPGSPATSSGTSSTTQTAKPSSTTTSNPYLVASTQRVKNAKTAATDLGDAVLDHFMKGVELQVARSLVATSARGGLIQMVSSLSAPTSAQIVPNSPKAIDSSTVRLTLEFQDVDGAHRFFLTVHVDDQSATITAINFGL